MTEDNKSKFKQVMPLSNGIWSNIFFLALYLPTSIFSNEHELFC